MAPIVALSALALVHCGGTTAGGSGSTADGGAWSDGGAGLEGGVPLDGGDTPDGNEVVQCTSGPSGTPVARPTCDVNRGTPTDAGPPSSCTTLADCADAGPYWGYFNGCIGGTCTFDECETDNDCPTGEACECSGKSVGDRLLYNTCIPTSCRTNADCASGGICSASVGGYCAGVTGYYCHSADDQCANDQDCTCTGAGASSVPAWCSFSLELGHFVCKADPGCNG